MESFESILASELPAALGQVFTGPGDSAAAVQERVSAFSAYLDTCHVPWEGLRCGPASAPAGVFLALLMPGRTAMVMLPTPGEHGINAQVQLRLTQAGLATIERRRLHYAQALLDPACDALAALVQQAGFQALAPLVYLERDATYPWVDPPDPRAAEWHPYQAEVQAEFARVVVATYEDSQDCPELTGLRPIEDVFAAHRASGRHDPDLWEIVRVGGHAAGCLLLSEMTHAPAIEIVYVGVVPGWRRRGLGQLLLRRALEQCRARGARQLSVVVDERNVPACRLYERFALAPVARREAYLYRWG